MKADVYLLDEPTNHLDTANVAWLENYLTHLPRVTSMIVSHDSGFLDNVCTDIIHYETLKLKRYKVGIPKTCNPNPRSSCNLESAEWEFAKMQKCCLLRNAAAFGNEAKWFLLLSPCCTALIFV